MRPSNRTLALVAFAAAVAAVAPVAGTAAAAAESPTFVNSTVTVSGGETAEIPVSLPDGSESVRVAIGSEAANFVVHATVVDGDGDGNVTLAVDTGVAGTTDAASYLSVSDGDDLENATQETDRLSSPLDPADYEMRLGPADDSRANGSLVVENASAAPATNVSGSDTAVDGETPTFADPIVTADSGQTAEIRVAFPGGNDSADVTVGSEAANFVVRATVVDGDGDGNVTLAVDTGVAGTTDAASYLSVSDGDELRNATQETDRLSAALDAGDYDMRIGPADDATAVGTLAITDPSTPSETTTAESSAETAAFDDAVVSVGRGQTAGIPITFADGSESARVAIGSEAANFVVRATVVDGDGDGDATLEVDTGAAGTTDAASYLSVSDGDDLENATQETDRLSSPLAPGDYDVRLGSDDDTVDIATLAVADTSAQTATAGTDGDATTAEAPATTTGSAAGDTQTSSPGFGVLAGVLSLLAVAGLAGRR
jgi:PGF-CTERM protein